jgi:hypothetical protein
MRLEGVWDEFRTRMIAPYVEASQAAKSALESLIMAGKLQETDQALADFDRKSKAVEKLLREPRTAYPFGNQAPNEVQGVVTYYQTVIDGARSQGRSGAESHFNLRPIPMNGQFGPSERFRSYSEELPAKLALANARAHAEAEEKRRADEAAVMAAISAQEKEREKAAVAIVKQKLAAVHDGKELLALADALPELLPAPPTDARGRDRMDETIPLQQSLRQLADDWMDGKLERAARADGGEPGGGRPYEPAIRTLRERILRETLVARLAAPELQAEPWSKMSVEEALNGLARKAGEERKWKRALELLQALTPQEARFNGDERVVAIRAYLTGTNLEQAEQYPEAILAYDAVLQEICDFSPVQEATDRLKALRKAHPEAFERLRRVDGAGAVPRPRMPLPPTGDFVK